MANDGCNEMGVLVQAELDGELSATESARVMAHVERCATCATLQVRLIALSERIRRDAPRHVAPAELRARVRPASPARRAPMPGGRAVSFAAGFALAACLAGVTLLQTGGGPGVGDAVVAAHIRALQPGHLMDVVSTDQHTVKPWFDGRLPFAPPVKDLIASGFPLTGGRLDYLAGRTAAVLTYRRRLHVIDLFVWPERGIGVTRTSSQSGYNIMRWNQDGMALSVVSDLNDRELTEFVDRWRGQ